MLVSMRVTINGSPSLVTGQTYDLQEDYARRLIAEGSAVQTEVPSQGEVLTLGAYAARPMTGVPSGAMATFSDQPGMWFWGHGATDWAQMGSGGGGVAGRSKLASAIAAYKAGMRTRPPLIMGVGDSNFTGEGAGSGGAVPKLNGAAILGPMERIKDVLPTLQGLTLRNSGIFGEGNSGNNGIAVGAYDPRIVLGSGWDRNTDTGQLGGRFLIAQANASGDLTINLGGQCDVVELHYATTPTSADSVQVRNNAGTLLQTFNSQAANGNGVTTVTGSFPDGVVRLRKGSTTGIFYLLGVIGYRTGVTTELVIARGSWSEAKAGDYSGTFSPWYGIQPIDLVQPDCTVIQLTINDITQNTATSTYNTNLAAVVDRCARWGDVVLMTGGNGSGTNYTNGVRENIEREMRKVGALYGCPTISLHTEWFNWAASNARGWEFDGNHRTAAGYLEQARLIAATLTKLASS